MISFSSLLFDARLLRVFNPKKATRIQIPIVTKVELLKTVNISALSNTKRNAITKINDEKRLAMRNREGSLIYFPPQATCPYGNPNANNIWKHIKQNNIITAIQATSSVIIGATYLLSSIAFSVQDFYRIQKILSDR